MQGEMEETWKLIVEKFNEAVNLRDPQESTGNLLLKLLYNLIHIFMSFWELLVERLDQVLPPESRSQTLHLYVHVGLTRVLSATLVILFLRCCYRYCSKYGRSAGKMMKAPGGKGAVIARAPFQDNPRDYFRNLRGKK